MKLLWYLLHARKQRRHGLSLIFGTSDCSIIIFNEMFMLFSNSNVFHTVSYTLTNHIDLTVFLWRDGCTSNMIKFHQFIFPNGLLLGMIQTFNKNIMLQRLKTLSNIWTWLKEWHIVSYHVSIIIIMNELIPGKEYDLCVCRVCYDIWIQCLFVVDLLRMV